MWKHNLYKNTIFYSPTLLFVLQHFRFVNFSLCNKEETLGDKVNLINPRLMFPVLCAFRYADHHRLHQHSPSLLQVSSGELCDLWIKHLQQIIQLYKKVNRNHTSILTSRCWDVCFVCRFRSTSWKNTR